MKARLALLFFIAISTSSFAQISFGVKGGLNFSKTVYNNTPTSFSADNEPAWTTGLHLGIFGQIKLSEKLSLIPELQFTQRGYSVTYAVTKSTSTVRINYMELPLLLSYKIKLVGIDFGPNISYALSSNYTGAYKNFDLGLEAGVRVYLDKKIFVTGRYYYGLATVSDITFFDFSGRSLGTVNERNRALEIGIGYKIK